MAPAQLLEVGTGTEQYIDVVNHKEGHNGRASNSQPFDAPRGYTIVGYEAVQHCQFGRGGWNISKLEAESDFISEQKVNELFEEVKAFAKQQGKESYNERLEQMRKHYLDTYSRVRSSHCRLIVNWEVKGNGNDLQPAGGRLHLGLKMKLVRLVSESELPSSKSGLVEAIRAGQPLVPPDGTVLQCGGLPAAVIVGGKRLQFAEAAAVDAISQRYMTVSRDYYHSVPYGAAINKGQRAIAHPGHPGAWATDEPGHGRRKWPVAGIAPLAANSSNLVGVSFEEYASYAASGDVMVR